MTDGSFRFRDHPATSAAPSAPRIRVSGDRFGRCYELAGRGVMEFRDWSLIHGRAFGVGHAWLECRGWTYDAVWDVIVTCEQYKGWAGAVTERVYSAKQAAECAASSGHWGPWDEVKS